MPHPETHKWGANPFAPSLIVMEIIAAMVVDEQLNETIPVRVSLMRWRLVDFAIQMFG